MNYVEFIKPELLAIIPVLNLIGAGIKKTNKIKDKYIPIILGVISVFISFVYVFLATDINATSGLATAIFTALTQGLLCAAASVYANQIYKQTTKEEEE